MKNDIKTDFTVKFDQNALKSLVILSKATGLNEKETMMSALGLYMWAYNEYKKGKRIGSVMIKENEDEVQFIKLPFMENDEKSSNSRKSELS